MWQFPSNAVAPCSWTPEESQVESYEHQDNASIHCQPFPESVSEEDDIYTDYDGCHRHQVKHDSYLSAHFRHEVTGQKATRSTENRLTHSTISAMTPRATISALLHP